MALCAVMTFSSLTVLAVSEDTPADTETGAVAQSASTTVAGDATVEPAPEYEDTSVWEPLIPESAAEAEEDSGTIKIYLNGERLALSSAPVIINGNTYVPLRSFCEALGCTVTWNGSITTVTRGSELTAEIPSDGDLVSANQRYFYMPAPTTKIEGNTMVPIRGLAKIFTLDIQWEQSSQTVYLTGGEALAWASDYYNADDLLWLSRIIYSESRGEPLEGKIAVGNVVINRTKAAAFPDTIHDVIFDTKNGTQFTPTKNGSIYNDSNEECILAAKLCLEGYEEVGGALYFLNVSKSTSGWIVRNRTFVTKIGCHSFYS